MPLSMVEAMLTRVRNERMHALTLARNGQLQEASFCWSYATELDRLENREEATVWRKRGNVAAGRAIELNDQMEALAQELKATLP